MHKPLDNSSNQVKIVYLFLFMVVAMFLFSTTMMLLVQIFPWLQNNIWYYRLSIFLQNMLLFILPAYTITAWSTGKPINALGIKKINHFLPNIFLTLLVFLFAIPAISSVEQWNSQTSLPQSWQSIEKLMRDMENSAAETTRLITADKTPVNLTFNILLIAVMTAIAEEMFFRGALQSLFQKWTKNIHLAVWITAFVFSAMHFQFFGFFPRLLLGAVLGYLFAYSANLWLPILFHATNNAAVLTMVYLENGNSISEKYNNLPTSISWSVVFVSMAAVAFMFYRLQLINKNDDTN